MKVSRLKGIRVCQLGVAFRMIVMMVMVMTVMVVMMMMVLMMMMMMIDCFSKLTIEYDVQFFQPGVRAIGVVEH